MPRHRKDCRRRRAALRGEGGFLRGGFPAFRQRPAAAHASARPPRTARAAGVRGPGSAASRGRLALARSLMVTPWFAAGAGIVIAAALAVDSPAALTYVPTDPAVRCPVTGCPGAEPGHGPDVAAATPGTPLPAGSGPREGAAPGALRRGAAAVPYQVGYQVARRWSSGFLATITIPRNLKPGPWSLQLAFPSARVDRVWGARWWPSGNGDAGTATGPWPGRERGRDDGGPGAGRSEDGQVVISATGTPTTPSACRLDGVSCRFG
ncbi:MAG TPA: cellulose binding domain-containing protein [Streptosporangiaceae bacterium]|nr:cellulose binding domain-containing protein [Streptosporangiaceae bacterium]